MDLHGKTKARLAKHFDVFKDQGDARPEHWEEFILHDSGGRETFEGGAIRDRRAGKGRYDLLSPLAIFRLARVNEKGAQKYSDRNWEKGIPLARCIDSALRHLFEYIEGLRDEDHLAQAMWNCMAAIHMEEMVKRGLMPEEMAEMPQYLTAQKSYTPDDEVGESLKQHQENMEAEKLMKDTLEPTGFPMDLVR